jgi:hypothetical protein
VEADLRRIEETVNEIVSELEYLRIREQKLRDTNESTNERVKWFAFGTMGMLVGLGAWQVVYLRAYFRYVLIDCGWGMSANDADLGRSISSRRVDDQLSPTLQADLNLHEQRALLLLAITCTRCCCHSMTLPFFSSSPQS